MVRTLTMVLAFVVTMVIARHRLFGLSLSERFAVDVDVEPACQHWFETPSGFWGLYLVKKFNSFYTFWNVVFYSFYKIAMAII